MTQQNTPDRLAALLLLCLVTVASAGRFDDVTPPPMPRPQARDAEKTAMLPDPDAYMPTSCEACIIFARELEAAARRLPKKMPRDDAEAWLIDQLEVDGVCKRMLDYRLHREHTGVARFSKEPPRIAKLAQEMEGRGVELRLDVPTNLLNEPTVESDALRRHCESLVEEFEEHLERWLIHRRNDTPLERYLCGEKFAKRDAECGALVASLGATDSLRNEL